MTIGLHQLGQIAIPVRDVDAADDFYGAKLGLRRLLRYGRSSAIRTATCSR